ncbi:hypothetical protein N665_1669s0001 [Sinapis alba]|nr:hypothetical protein N665_1669s0001 [Sinapis alba]
MVTNGILLRHKDLMCDANDFVVGAVIGQKKDKKLHDVYYASKTLDDAHMNYVTIEKELLAVVFAFEKFQPYLVGSKLVVHIDHAALKYLMQKKDATPIPLGWILLLQEFDIEIKDKKAVKNGVADHLSRIINEDDVPIDVFLPIENVYMMETSNGLQAKVPVLKVPKHLKRPINALELAVFRKPVKKIHKDVSFEDAYEGHQLINFFRNSRETKEEVKALYDEVRSVPPKVKKLTRLKDPGKFVVPCTISGVEFSNALCNIGSSISSMSKDISNKLGLVT